jgi:hypothetical protein
VAYAFNGLHAGGVIGFPVGIRKSPLIGGPFNDASHNQSVDGLSRIDQTGIVRKVIDIRQAASVGRWPAPTLGAV